MRFGLISCVHGNLPAFQAVLRDVEQLGCDSIVCLGDIVGYFDHPKECLDLVRSKCRVSVKGNHDEYCSGSHPLKDFNAQFAEMIEWTRGELSPVDRAWLSELPYSLVNVGSVGQPRDGHAGAAYVVYDSNSRTVELRRVGYPPPPSGGHGKAKPVPGGGGPPKTISDEIAEHKQRHG